MRCGDALPTLPGYGGAGAIWDIFAAGPDAQRLRSFLRQHASEFVHKGRRCSVEVSDASAAAAEAAEDGARLYAPAKLSSPTKKARQAADSRSNGLANAVAQDAAPSTSREPLPPLLVGDPIFDQVGAYKSCVSRLPI